MLSVSYRDQAVRDLDLDAKRKGVLLLCEMGLDPGIDHMSAMSLIRRLAGDGGRDRRLLLLRQRHPRARTSRTTRCATSITWNPRNVVMAGYDGRPVHGGRQDQDRAVPPGLPPHLGGRGRRRRARSRPTPTATRCPTCSPSACEHVETMIRGTLRYPGWSETWAQIVRSGCPTRRCAFPTWPTGATREVVEMFLPLNISSGSARAARRALPADQPDRRGSWRTCAGSACSPTSGSAARATPPRRC